MTMPAGIFGSPREWAQDLAIATGIGAFLGVIGPFGSFNGGPIEVRIFYWIANLWIGFIILSLTVRVSLWVGRRWDLPTWFVLPVGTAVGAAPVSIAVMFFAARFWPGAHGQLGSLPIYYAQTLAISEPCTLCYFFLTVRSGWRAQSRAGFGINPAPDSPVLATFAEAGFLDRLPPRLGRNLLCLQMEDHYVRAHTDQGSDLMLTPLKAAIAELGQVEGMQVHRSWWVARAAVAGAVQHGRNVRLKLSNGMEVPVARASVAVLRANRWLDSDFGA
jgi:hypothetical protein